MTETRFPHQNTYLQSSAFKAKFWQNWILKKNKPVQYSKKKQKSNSAQNQHI